MKPEEFVAQRKLIPVYYDQYCFHYHLNPFTYNSADLFRNNQLTGMYPFMTMLFTFQARTILLLVMSCWKLCEELRGLVFPKRCPQCDLELSSGHLLLECKYSEYFRDIFGGNWKRIQCGRVADQGLGYCEVNLPIMWRHY